ncbi:radical SAM protein, partial [candidate division CSSED10-310 bacterium]
MYQYLFGPVPSRRLGKSLGVDLVPHKTCSYNCVYCECGPTTNLTLERREYVVAARVLNELHHYLEHNAPPDYLTFSGFGEPTLNIKIGEVLRGMQEQFPAIKVAVLTNGSMLQDHAVRKEINSAQVVIPSLDAVSEDVFHFLNRPHRNVR